MSAYFIFHNRITDPSKMQEYVPRAFASLTPYEPEFLVLDENSHVVEGSTHLPMQRLGTILQSIAKRSRCASRQPKALP